MSSNPLMKHFRRPAIYLKLPSRGKFWTDNSLDLPVTGDIPVYPMTSGDEIALKTPDALMNGSSIVTVIQSCCPNIKDAWQMPSIDVDATLIAIRIASYGTNMGVTTECPNCKTSGDYEINLSNTLDNIRAPDYNVPVLYEQLKIKLRPQMYFTTTQVNITNYEEQRIMQALADTEISDEVRNAKLKESMDKIVAINDDLMVKSTEYIELEDGTKVTSSEYIREFYKNAPSKVVKLIQEHTAKLAQEGALPLMQLTCDECHKDYTSNLEFDYASFFVTGS